VERVPQHHPQQGNQILGYPGAGADQALSRQIRHKAPPAYHRRGVEIDPAKRRGCAARPTPRRSSPRPPQQHDHARCPWRNSHRATEAHQQQLHTILTDAIPQAARQAMRNAAEAPRFLRSTGRDARRPSLVSSEPPELVCAVIGELRWRNCERWILLTLHWL